jgi:ADP-ribose pyrophosphatase YjhB (NUDIX family)
MQIITNSIVTCNDKVLLVKKRSESGIPKTFWELPGGPMVDEDISVEHAAMRSTHDDLGIHTIVTGQWFSNKYKKEVNIVLSAQLCDERDAYQLRPSPRVLKYAWVHRTKIADYEVTPLTRDRIGYYYG